MATFRYPMGSMTSDYPEHLVIPSTLKHKQTIIILHDRLSNSQTFGPPFLSSRLPDGRTFKTAFPYAKFVIPTAFARGNQGFGGSRINQWFYHSPLFVSEGEESSLPIPEEEESRMIQGLRETCVFIHSLLRDAVEEVGAHNVALGGFSQGCAAMLISLLTWTGEPLGALFGMCGWLPFEQHLKKIVRPMSPSEDSRTEDEGTDGNANLPAEAIAWLRKKLNLPPIEQSPPGSTSLPFQHTNLNLFHGQEDVVVNMELGEQARLCLASLGARVQWSEYPALGHWYSELMLGELVNALADDTTGWTEKCCGMDTDADAESDDETVVRTTAAEQENDARINALQRACGRPSHWSWC